MNWMIWEKKDWYNGLNTPLNWAGKFLKTYLESKEVIVKFPKDVIKEAFQAELIGNGELWLEMLKNRNFVSHTYNEEIFADSIHKIINYYFNEIQNLYTFLSNEQ